MICMQGKFEINMINILLESFNPSVLTFIDAQIKATLPKDFNILEKLAAKAKKVNLVCNFQDDEVEESKTNY
jgi:hypothetical protein